jgi:hypothetical protein
MVKKFWAYYKSDKGMECVNIYEAMKLENSLIKNKDKQIEFWDMRQIDKAEKVHTCRTASNGRTAHFVYYPGSTHQGVCSEMSMTHKVYQLVYFKARYLVLYAFGKEIKIFIKNSEQEYYYKTEYNTYSIDIIYELEKTEPASYFYKWRGILALEIKVTHKIDPSKKNDLTAHGIQIFEVNIYDNQKIPEDSFSLEKLNYNERIIKSKVEKSNYKVIGNFINDIVPKTNSIMEQRYTVLADFENEKLKLQKQIKDNEEKIDSQIKHIEKRSEELHNINKQYEEYQNEISKYKEQISRTDELIQNNKQITNQYKNAQATIFEMQKELYNEKNKGFLKRILGR